MKNEPEKSVQLTEYEQAKEFAELLKQLSVEEQFAVLDIVKAARVLAQRKEFTRRHLHP